MVDDNPADIDLTSEVLSKRRPDSHMNCVSDGEQAIYFLRREREHADAPMPDLVVLDLNLPRRDGRQVLTDIKSDPKLARIPVVVFTTSEAACDVGRSYELGANCYLRKPGNLADFTAIVQCMADFWLGFATLPQKERR